MNVLARVSVSIALAIFSTFGNATPATALDAEAVERVIAADRQPAQSHADKLISIQSEFSGLESIYQHLIDNLQAASEEELNSLWRLSSFMAYATNKYQFAGNMLQVDNEFTHRKITPPIEIRERLLESLIGFRKFDEARAYAAKANIPIEYIPNVLGESEGLGNVLGILKVDVDQGTLVRQNISPDDDAHIFVVSFIGCTFSRHAADAIEKNQVLRNFMREHATWIVLPGPLYFNDVRAWNRDHPSTPFTYVDNMESWGFIDDWATPTFYVLKRGKVVAKLKGWLDDAAGTAALLEVIFANSDVAQKALNK